MHNVTMNDLFPGWHCAHCLEFNGEAKEPRDTCRACDMPKALAGTLSEDEPIPYTLEDARPMHLRVEKRFCVLEVRPDASDEPDPSKRLPAVRTFVVFAEDELDARCQVREWYEANFPEVKCGHLTASPAGTWEAVGLGPTGDVQRRTVGDSTAQPYEVFEGRSAPSA